MAIRLMGTHAAVTRKMPVSSFTGRKGALVQHVAGAASLALLTTATALHCLGILENPCTSGTTTEAQVTLLTSKDLVSVDISEIVSETTLTATAGTTVTIVDSTLNCVDGDDVFIGATLEVLTCASGDSSAGDILTVTDYAQSTGTFTFAAVGATGFASSDTFKIVTVGQRFGGQGLLCMNTTYADEIVLDSAGEAGSAKDGDWFRCIDVTPDGKKAVGYITCTAGTPTVVVG